MYVIWDLDGVMIPGRGTTHLANGYNRDPKEFEKRFLDECGKNGPLRNIDKNALYRGFREWEIQYNNGKPISTIGELATSLTDLRHKLHVFPSSEQTIYTKNAILSGLTLKRIKEIADRLPYNSGCKESIETISKKDINQFLFSNSNWALVDAVAKKFGFEYSEGATPKIHFWYEYYDPEKVPELLEEWYSPKFFNYKCDPQYGEITITLTGEIKPFDKKKRVFKFLKKNKIDPKKIIAIDDTEINMLKELRDSGATVIGFYNPNDRDMKEKDLKKMQDLSIPVLRDLKYFAEIVLDPREAVIGRYCR